MDQDIHDDDQFVDAKDEIFSNEDEVKTDAEIFNSFITTSFKTKPDQLNYAKIAKRVDVRQLKDNIWAELKLESLNKVFYILILTFFKKISTEPYITCYTCKNRKKVYRHHERSEKSLPRERNGGYIY